LCRKVKKTVMPAAMWFTKGVMRLRKANKPVFVGPILIERAGSRTYNP
jgi:hypothetical protein